MEPPQVEPTFKQHSPAYTINNAGFSWNTSYGQGTSVHGFDALYVKSGPSNAEARLQITAKNPRLPTNVSTSGKTKYGDGSHLREIANSDKNPSTSIVDLAKLSLITARVYHHFKELKELPIARNVRQRTSHARAHLTKVLDESKDSRRQALKDNVRVASVLSTSPSRMYSRRSRIRDLLAQPHAPVRAHVGFVNPLLSMSGAEKHQMLGRTGQGCNKPTFKISPPRTTVATTRTDGAAQFSYAPLNLATEQAIRALKTLNEGPRVVPANSPNLENKNGTNINSLCSNCSRILDDGELICKFAVADRSCAKCGDISVREMPTQRHSVKAVIDTETWKYEVLWEEDTSFISSGAGAESFITRHSGRAWQLDGSIELRDRTANEHGEAIGEQYPSLDAAKSSIYCGNCRKVRRQCMCYEELVIDKCIICAEARVECNCWNSSKDTAMFVKDFNGEILSATSGAARNVLGHAPLAVADGVSLREGFLKALALKVDTYRSQMNRNKYSMWKGKGMTR